ncbi:hypothetical protein BGW39_009951 [Mortierella sp. 14UC]|nr:hypothetical protein BGW39_009951 [Mortierella sp. 14UC]
MIRHFDLPSDVPNNQGALVKLDTFMKNPSPIGITLGSIVVDLFYEGTHLGQVTAQNATLVGGGSGSPLDAPLQSPVPLQITQGVKIMDMGIAFNSLKLYVPTVFSKNDGRVQDPVQHHCQGPVGDQFDRAGVDGGTSEHIVINVVVTLTNPSSLTVGIGNAMLTVSESMTNQFLGDLVIQSLTLVPASNGPMQVPAQFLFHPTDALVRDQFLSRFVTGDTFPLHATGSPTLSTPLPELQRALSLVSLSCSAAGLIPPPILFPSGRTISTLNTVLGSH